MTPRMWVNVVLAIAGFLFVFAVASTIKGWYDDAQRYKLADQVIETTSGLGRDGEEADAMRDNTNGVIADVLDTHRTNTRNDNEADPILRDRDARRVPDSVRERAREARLARERSGNGAKELEKGAGPENPAER